MSLQRLKSACVGVRAPAMQGTAYLVGPTTLVTCHHVVESAGEGKDVELLLETGTRPARVVKMVAATDCAVLSIDTPLADRQPLPIAGRCEGHAQWDGYGFPGLAKGAGVSFFGMVLDPEALDDLKRPVVTLYSDMLAAGMAAPVHGLSGGPVLVDGSVVGHFSRVLGTPGAPGQPALGVVYAARAASVLDVLGTSPDVATVRAQPRAALADLIPPVGPGEHHVFISYRASDSAFAGRLVERLDAVGLRVFLDQREIVPDERVGARLQEALDKSRAGIVLVSRAWLESRWCLEAARAIVVRAAGDAKGFSAIPLRIDSVEMPPIFADRVWVDFAGESAPSGRKLEQLIYAILGKSAPREGSVDAKVQVTLTDATDEAMRRVDDLVRDPTRFQSFMRFLHDSGLPEAAPRLRAAGALIGAGRLEPALAVLPPAETSLRARQLRALALSKMRRDDDALALLEPLFEHNEVNVETGGILGGIYKRMWQRTGDRTYLMRSLDTYSVTYAATADWYVGINVASMALLLDHREDSLRSARAVRDQLQAVPEGQLDHWGRATLAESFLVLDDLASAARWYEKAAALAFRLPSDIATMRRQVRLLLPKLGRDANALDGSLPVPAVVAFSGHMTDAPDRAVPRFPESKTEAVRLRIRAWLRSHGGRVHGVASAARGSDILFLEEVLASNGTATVVLPFPKDDFKKVSVGQGWDERFDAVLAHERVEVLPPLLERMPVEAEQPAAFERCNLAIVDKAEGFGERFDDAAPTLLTVWNGSPGDATGGTAHAVTLWRQRAHPSENIDLSQL
jgi:hypothetical protein